MNIELVETERLILLRPAPSDIDDLYRFYTDPRTMATLGGLRSPELTHDLAERIIIHWKLHAFGAWIVREAATGRFMGRGGLRLMLLEGRPEIELGYGFLPEFWGRGFATELGRVAVQVGFEHLAARDLCCFTEPTNRASLNVMTKLGFTFERDGIYAGTPHVFHRLRRPA